MKIVSEFKEFAIKGNAVDMAIGIVIGAAFGTVVNSLVNDIITPPIGKLLGGVDFSNLFWSLSGSDHASIEAAKAAGDVTINYGLFIESIVSFLVVAWALFMMVKLMNKLRKENPPQEPSAKNCAHCCSTIPQQATRCPYCTSHF